MKMSVLETLSNEHVHGKIFISIFELEILKRIDEKVADEVRRPYLDGIDFTLGNRQTTELSCEFLEFELEKGEGSPGAIVLGDSSLDLTFVTR